MLLPAVVRAFLWNQNLKEISMFCLLCEESQRSAWPARALPFSSPRWRIDWAVQHYRNTWISGGTNVYNWSLPLWLPAVALSFYLSFSFFAAAQHDAPQEESTGARTHGVCPALSCSLSLERSLTRSSTAIHCTFLYDNTLTGEAWAASSHAQVYSRHSMWCFSTSRLAFSSSSSLSGLNCLMAVCCRDCRGWEPSERNIALFSCKPLLSTYCTLEGSLKAWP